jgi:adenylate cyclase
LLDFSVGITLGYATLGRIGFDLVSERVLSEVEDLVDADPAGQLTLKGFVKPVSAFSIVSVLPHEGEAEPQTGSEQSPGEVAL